MIIRLLLEREYPRYAQHLKRLNADDRYMRFNNATTDEQIDTHVITAQLAERVVIVGLNNEHEIVAALEMASYGDEVEVGLTVEESHRGQGNGTRLFIIAVDIAQGLGVKIMRSHCLSHNRFMVRIARSMGMEVHCDDGEATGELSLIQPAK